MVSYIGHPGHRGVAGGVAGGHRGYTQDYVSICTHNINADKAPFVRSKMKQQPNSFPPSYCR